MRELARRIFGPRARGCQWRMRLRNSWSVAWAGEGELCGLRKLCEKFLGPRRGLWRKVAEIKVA
jgi:hypothetical protein